MNSEKYLIAAKLNNKFKTSLEVVAAVINSLDEVSDDNFEEIIANHFIKDTPIRSTFFVEKVVDNYTREEFQRNFGMQIESYEFLLGEVSKVYKEQFPNYTSIPVDVQLLAVIWILSNRESYRSIGDRFSMAKSTLSWVFFRIIKILNILAPRFIQWPDEEEAEKIKTAFRRQHKINDIIGAIDGTYCPISAPASKSHCYTNRKQFHSITMQAVCDNKMIFLDCFVGYPSSVHDARIFRNSPLHEKASSSLTSFFPGNTKILGDKAYPCLPWCIPPYKDTGRLNVKQKCFNKIHASTRQIIERCFALFFGRFRRFQYLEMKDIKNMPATILAGCVLHNVCLQYNEDITIIERYVRSGTEQSRRSATEYVRCNSVSTNDGRLERDKMADEIWNLQNNHN